MAVWRFVNINLKEAQLLADLTGIQSDLEATAAICDLLMKEIKKGQYDLYLADALSSAALVRYARSFTSGVRTKIPKSIQTLLSSELLKEHKWFIDLRDKYVAHSVNAFEDHQVVAYLVPEERGQKDVSSISSVQQTRLACLGGADIADLKALCAELGKHVGALIEKEKAKVLEATKQVPVENLYSQKDPPPRFAKKTDVAKSRKRN